MITVRGKGLTLEQIKKINPKTPEGAGKRWSPVRHYNLILAIKAEATARGWAIAEERYATARDGADMAGAIMFEKVPGLRNIPGMKFALGFLNSNARRKALKLTVGAQITCCTNGMCSGTILLNRVHDHTIDLKAQIKEALDSYLDNAKAIPDMVVDLQGYELTDAEASHILLEIGCRYDLRIGASTIMRVYKEYKNPTYPEHGKGTSWALLNAFTYAARPNIAATRQMEAYEAFRLMLPTYGEFVKEADDDLRD